MRSDPHRWLIARLLWRWGALFWIGPSLGLLAGLVLVFGFLKENKTDRIRFDAGMLPEGVDVTPYLAELRSELGSESTLTEVQRQLDRDSFLKTPLWWLRPRIKVDYMSGGSWGVIHMRFTHHTASGREELSDAFKVVAKEAVPRIRAKYVGGWLEKIDARLGEIRLAVNAAESESVYRSGILDERYQLEWHRKELLRLRENPYYVGYERSDSAHYGRPAPWRSATWLPAPWRPAPWWKSPPKWAILIFMCSGYGLMAVFPAVIVLEMMWPLRRTANGMTTEAA